MSTINSLVRKYFAPPKRIKPGIYHFQAPPQDPRNYRLHLRVEADGQGILIVNAATILHLNQTATEMGYYLIQEVPEEDVAELISSRYHVNRDQALTDYQDLKGRIDTIITTPDLDPVSFLDFDREIPFTGHISAPYRLDCALTYRLPPGEDPRFAPTKQVSRELSTQEWLEVIDKAWQAGIPHLVFTGGEPTLRDDLAQMIQKAEENGQVTGLLTNGRRFIDSDYLQTLLNTGLDHVMIIWDPKNSEQWEALTNTIREDLFVAVHLTISEMSVDHLDEILRRFVEAGIDGLSLSASSSEYVKRLQSARDLAAHLQLELTWNLPVPYSSQNPVNLEIPNQELLERAGQAWLYIEPDGDVLPTQGDSQVVGNITTQSFEEISATIFEK